MGTWMEPGWVWEPGWELEWEPEWEAGWEPEWEPEWEPGWNLDGYLNGNLDGNLNGNLTGKLDGSLIGNLDGNLNGNQTGTRLGPNEAPSEVPWGSLGASLELPGRTRGGPQGSGAPVGHRGSQKCQKCVTVVKNRPGDKRPGSAPPWILGPPRGLSKRPH